MSITDFLLARIAEDEAVARAASGDSWHGQGCAVRTVPESGKPWSWSKVAEMYHANHFADAAHIARHDPARVLAECAAKRVIVELADFHRERRDAYRSPRSIEAEDTKTTEDRRRQEARSRVAEDVVRTLAAVYADHPAYRDEWRVGA